jgi:hypothetical protein
MQTHKSGALKSASFGGTDPDANSRVALTAKSFVECGYDLLSVCLHAPLKNKRDS